MLTRNDHEQVLGNAGRYWQAFESAHKQDFIGNKYVAFDAKGDELGRFASAKDARLIANASSVRHEDFLTIQDQLVSIRRRKLTAIMDLMSAGLSFNEDISQQLVGFENSSDMEDADQDMNPNMTDFEGSDFEKEFVPCPVTHKGFRVDWRQGSFDYKRSVSMDNAIRKVAERLEKTLVNGNDKIVVSYGGQNHPLYGYTTHPNRGTNATTMSDFTNIANIGNFHKEIIRETGLMWSTQGGLELDSVMLYVANDIFTNLQDDYKADSERSALAKTRDNTFIKDVKALESLTGNQMVLVEMQSSTIQLAVEADIQVIPYIKAQPMESQKWACYGAMTHLIKSDRKGKTGIRHLTVF